MGEEGYETGAGSTRMRRGGKGDSAEVTSKGATSKGATGKMPKTYGRRKTLKTYGRSLTGPLLPSGDREGAETQECGAEMDIDSDGSQQQ